MTSSAATFDYGVSLYLAAWFAIGAACAAFVHWRLGRGPGLGTAAALWLLGPAGLLVVAIIIVWSALAGHDRERARLIRGDRP